MKFRNPHDFAVDLDELGLVGVQPGESIEATGRHAESLLAQGWTRIDKPKSRKGDDIEGTDD